MIVFALGGFTCIISILRLQSLLVFLQTTDISYHNPLAAIWSSLEVNIGILCSCLPTLKAMVTRWFPRAFGNSYLRGSDHSHERRGCANLGGADANKNTASSNGSTLPTKHKSSFSFDAFCRGPGRENATQKTTVRSGPKHYERNERNYRSEQPQRRLWPLTTLTTTNNDSTEDIELDALGHGGQSEQQRAEEQRGIQVVTVVEQEVERGRGYGGTDSGNGGHDAKSEAGSESELVGGTRRGKFGNESWGVCAKLHGELVALALGGT